MPGAVTLPCQLVQCQPPVTACNVSHGENYSPTLRLYMSIALHSPHYLLTTLTTSTLPLFHEHYYYYTHFTAMISIHITTVHTSLLSPYLYILPCSHHLSTSTFVTVTFTTLSRKYEVHIDKW